MNTIKHGVMGYKINEIRLGDVVTWNEEGSGVWSGHQFVCQKENGQIGLINLISGKAHKLEFQHTSALLQHLKQMIVKDKEINVINSGDWVVYVP